ncbi:uncharacterized protein B0T23DRAFT_392328 [Neurospora hispaniola]|uniref:Uncharacterized protein n=1 Tax=Neurospora hispaniola TaxID=588809 RepID=A0AAJ0IGB9_9PEZI|nr:hypothetical protein B0T23DRAFT_392328 [Neurospora hispaniola]
MANRYHTDDLRLAWFSRMKFRALSNAAARNSSLHSWLRSTVNQITTYTYHTQKVYANGKIMRVSKAISLFSPVSTSKPASPAAGDDLIKLRTVGAGIAMHIVLGDAILSYHIPPEHPVGEANVTFGVHSALRCTGSRAKDRFRYFQPVQTELHTRHSHSQEQNRYAHIAQLKLR